jgi:hypothetical protein
MDEQIGPLVSDEIVAVAAVIGAVATLPMLIEFLIDRAKRRERISLSIESVPVAGLRADLAGCDTLLQGIADLIDRAKFPDVYGDQRVGNEILVIGPPLSGKKTLAKKIAVEAAIDDILIVHNPRNADALAKAKQLVQKSGSKKLMLLLPRLDLINPKEDEELLTELDALIEIATGRPNVLVIGTAIAYVAGNEIDNLFGMVLAMPGTQLTPPSLPPQRSDVRQMLQAVTEHYLQQALRDGYELKDITEAEFVARVLRSATNPAQIEDIVALCETAARYRQRIKETPTRQITPRILETVMHRVIIEEDRNLWAHPA